MSEWISVDERLPDERGYYLTIDEDSDMDVKFFNTSTNNWETHITQKDGEVRAGYKVYIFQNYIFKTKHWMPLPSPPLKAKQDQEARNDNI